MEGSRLAVLAAALADPRGAGEDPGPPLTWSAAGSRAAALLGAPARGLLGAAGKAAGPLAGSLLLAGRRPAAAAALVLAGVPLLRILGGPGTGDGAAAVLLLLGGLSLLAALLGALHEGGELRIAAAALAAGLLLRLGAAAFLAAAGGLPDETGLYHPLAADAAARWAAGVPSDLATHPFAENRGAYLRLLSATYLFAGPGLLAGRVLGILLGLLAAILAGELARPLGGARAASLAVAAAALHPEAAFWSATLGRDALTTVIVLLALAVLARRPGRLLRGWILAAAVPVAVLAENSFPLAGVLGAVVVLLALLEALAAAAAPGPRRWILPPAALLLAAGALAFVGWRYGAWFTPEVLTSVRRNTVGNAPDFLPGLAFGGLPGILAFLPLGALFVLLAPWPWTAAGGARSAYGLAALAGAAVTLLGIAGLAAALRRRPAAALPAALFLLVALGLLGILEANSGIVVRHRLPLGGILCAGTGVLLSGWEGLRRP